MTRQAKITTLNADTLHATEYKEIHEQRMVLIRSYNMWFAIGCGVAFSSYWLILNLSLTMSSRPTLIAQDVVPQSRDQVTYSFAPIVEKTLPAVVNIYARKIIR